MPATREFPRFPLSAIRIPGRIALHADELDARGIVDGKEVWRTKEGGVCQVPLYLKLSTEIGEWAGDIRKAKLPDDFVVDYVRVYDLVVK
jgi:hypothetical protein